MGNYKAGVVTSLQDKVSEIEWHHQASRPHDYDALDKDFTELLGVVRVMLIVMKDGLK